MRILLVDDQPEILKMLRKFLEEQEHHISMANNGSAALNILRNEKFDLIISDVFMPVMDGFELCRIVKGDKKLKDILFIFYTGTYKDEKDEDFALKLGAEAYLRKPESPIIILETINRLSSREKERKASKHTKSPHSEKEIYKLYNERLVNKLEKNVLDLEKEINERKKAENAQQESEKWFRAIFDQAPIGIATIDVPSGQFIELNEKYCNITGYSKEEMLSSIYQNITHPDDIQVGLDKREMLRIGKISNFHLEKRYISKNGGIVWVQLVVVPLWSEDQKKTVHLAIVEDITERKEAEEALKNTLAELEKLKNQLQEENIYLQEEIKKVHNFDEIIGNSVPLNKMLSEVEQISPTDSTILIIGETGTGKELVARAIHNLSNRSNRSLVKVNCAALPGNLIESELFGHEKGAFTGAITTRKGRFELADGGTIFLDEIGELPLELQTKLLRVIQEGEFERVGGEKTYTVDVRIIAATNRNLEQEIEQKTFRKDLYYRLNVFPIRVPALRDRVEDIPVLAQHFAQKHGKKSNKHFEIISKKTLDILLVLNWPGNIRELENVIERGVIFSKPPVLQLDEKFLSDIKKKNLFTKSGTLDDMERKYIFQILEEKKWVISGERGAAKVLGLKESTLRFKMKKFAIKKPEIMN